VAPGRDTLTVVPSDTLLSSLRASLDEERGQLKRQLAELGANGGGLSFDENFADSGEVAAQQGEAMTLAGSLQDQLKEVETALRKIDEGKFGLCENCGKEITEARLEAIPTARYCIDCASSRG
jgi:DnaK suppressor protein